MRMDSRRKNLQIDEKGQNINKEVTEIGVNETRTLTILISVGLSSERMAVPLVEVVRMLVLSFDS